MKKLVTFLRWQLLLIIGGLSLAIAPFVANSLEPLLIQPTAQLMTFVLSGRFAEHRFIDGIPSVYYRRLNQTYENPVYASVYALWYYEQAQGQEDVNDFLQYYNIAPPPEPSGGYLEYFFNVADWLVDSMVVRRYRDITFGVWQYPFAWDIYNLESGWVSGMAQGLGVQVLLRAWLESGQDKYQSAIHLAENAFRVPVDSGGVTRFDSTSSWWYEEYASPEALESRVFNGAAHAVLALLELHTTEARTENTATLLEHGINAIRDRLQDYDASWWTYYDATGIMANYKYHHVNISLLRQLGLMRSDSEFLNTAQRWAGYQTSFFKREFLWQTPTPSDFALLIVAASLVFAIIFVVFIGIQILSSFFAETPRGSGESL